MRPVAFGFALFAVVTLGGGCSGQEASTQATTSRQTKPSSSQSAESGSAELTQATAGPAIHQPAKAGHDWPVFLGPRGDSTSKESGIDPATWKPHPPIKWTLPLGVSYGGPVVVGDRLLLLDRHDDVERLSCFQTSDGKELWRHESAVDYRDMYGYNNGPRCCPIVDGDHVYTYGVAGQLSCVRLEDGELLWSNNLNQEYGVIQNFFGVASAPFIYEDLILVMVGGSPEDTVGRVDFAEPNGTAIVAFDKLSGEEEYRLGDDLASYSSMTVRKIEGKDTGLAFLRGGLIAFEPKSGKQLFDFPWRAEMLESVNAAQPVTFGDQILLSETYDIGSVLLEVKDGEPQVLRKDEGNYRELTFRAHWATPVLIDGYLYGCSGRNEPDCDFRCVRWSDGELQWFTRKHERSSVLVVDGYLIVLGEFGTLELIRPTPEKLEVVASADLSQVLAPGTQEVLLKSPCWAAPVLAHGQLYLRGKNRLVCLNLIPAEESR